MLRGIDFDITELKLREQQLFNTKERLEAIMMASPVRISFSSDQTCQFISGNSTLFSSVRK